ncbi:hypothetical protein V2J09_006673 [Rumex salicifolius]
MQLPIILTFLVLSFTSQPLTLAQVSSKTDQQSLLTFKSFITSDPHQILTTWNTSVPFCTWKGVSCNTTKQRVTALNLSDFTLSGSMAPHLGNLSFLQELILNNNLFSGQIPVELGKLFRLTTLNLSTNHLQGSIPGSISQCLKLVYLDLSHNRLEGSLPSELGSLSRLDALRVSYNNLTGSIPPSLGNLSLVTNIILSNNKLQGKIPESLGDLPFLVNIDLSLNFLDGEVPSSIFNLSSLIQLMLAANRFSGVLPSNMFSKLNSLTYLSLGGNYFSGPLPVSLGNASNLQRADFSVNQFSGQIPLLWNLPVIQFLNFGSNNFVSDGLGGWDFLKSLANSTQLQVLAVDTNHLSGELPALVGNLSQQLYMFVMGGNQIEGRLPGEISNLVGLNMISFEYNRFSGEIPDSIGSLRYLQSLYLHNNNFSGEIPSSFGKLSFLFELTLKANHLRGPIPSSLEKLSRLQVLDLSVNELTGTIPVKILNNPSFSKLLNLSFNSLTGHIPFEIGKLKMVQAIDVSSNQLSGEIPSTLGDCSNILLLNMSRNSLQGSMPTSLDNLRGVLSIDLSYNNLSGLIPSSLQNLRVLQFLDLSVNHLTGIVPTKGVFSGKSKVLLDGNPGLCGGVPELSLPKCRIPTKKSPAKLKNKLILGLIVGLILVLGVSVSLLSLFRIRKRRRTQLAGQDHGASPELGQYKLHKYYDIKAATGNFNIQNMIGSGSFGKVYKGVFKDGSQAAIKVFNLENSKASKSFLAECEALRNIRHRNLVRILGVCSNPDFKALVLPYMPNSSLETWLHSTSELKLAREEGLNLKQRLEIAMDVASALEYLHHDCETSVVHCDLKPSNVLLDEKLCAHVADFGIARILSSNSPYSSTLGLKGSIGYIAPEYGGGSKVSTKGDVYSYGIMLLEMFTGKRPTDEVCTDELDLQGWVSNGLTGRVMDILDPELRSEFKLKDDQCLFMVFEIGLHCSLRSPNERPTMREVCRMIRNAMDEISFFLLLLVLLVLKPKQSASENTTIIYNGFKSAKLTLDGIATVTQNGLLMLTNDTKQEKAHAFHPNPIPFKDSPNGSVVSFSVTFVFAIISQYATLSGHGIAFVIAPTRGLPYSLPSQYLGLFNKTNNGNATNQVVAVELDTILSSEFQDINDNHVGIDINSLQSSVSNPASYHINSTTSVNVSLYSGKAMQIWIEYDGAKKKMDVTLGLINMDKPSIPLLSLSKDLSSILNESMFIGFSSSTGSVLTSHYILGWSFALKGIAPSLDISSLPKLPKIKHNHVSRILMISLPIIIASLAVGGYYGYMYIVQRKRKFAEEMEDWESQYGPQRFKYKHLYVATKGFREKGLLGSGGFGRVYRGILPKTKIEVAVKKVSHESRQGMREFVAEIASMGRLRHRNLVQLLGYCRRKGELLLHTRTGRATRGSDVFAFGAFLLEVVCGRRPIDLHAPTEDMVLVDMVFASWKRGEILRMVDRRLGGEYVEEEVDLVLKLGLMCSNVEAEDRPTMREAVAYLDGVAAMPDLKGLELNTGGVCFPGDRRRGMMVAGWAAGAAGREGFSDFAMSYPSSYDRTFTRSGSVADSHLSEGR